MLTPTRKKTPENKNVTKDNQISQTNTKTPEKEHEKVTLKEFITLTTWAVKTIFSLEKKYAVLMTIFNTLKSARGILYTYVVSKLLDSIISNIGNGEMQLNSLIPYMIGIFVYYVASSALGYSTSFYRGALREKLRPGLQRYLYKKLNDLGVQSMEDPEITNMSTRSRESLFDLNNYFFRVLGVLGSFVSLIITAVIVLKNIPLVFVVVALVAIPSYFYDKKYRILSWRLYHDYTEESRNSGWTASSLSNPVSMKEISINNAFSYLDKLFADFRNWFAQKSIGITKKWFFGLFVIDIFSNMGILYGFAAVFLRLIHGTITVGQAYFLTGLINRLDDNIDYISGEITSLFEYALRLKDIHSLFEKSPAFADGDKDFGKLEEGPSIDIQGVSFCYPSAEDTLVLKDLSLKIESGEKIAIVGANGAGKTTFVKLLCKMYLPSEGRILANEVDLKDITNVSWHQNLGVLFQDFNTYDHLTVKQNILLGNPGFAVADEIGDGLSEEYIEALDMSTIEEAAQRADALGFIKDFPNGFDQVLSERFKGGVRPSTGQWQKIAIARFFYRNAPFVIFDEPTAAIDAVSEYNIFNEIYSFFEGKTVIIISHRFSTVRNADRIIVVDNGEIVEQGSHADLMEFGGKYATAFNLQAEGYQS